MRLSLRKQLKPYRDLTSLAKDADLSIPELNRRIRELQREGRLSLKALSVEPKPDHEMPGEGIFELFYQFERCLVCGNEMKPPHRRDIGWGEFKQCEKCDYSAHDMASYPTRKKAATEQLSRLVKEAQKTQTVLRDRKAHHELLRPGL